LWQAEAAAVVELDTAHSPLLKGASANEPQPLVLTALDHLVRLKVNRQQQKTLTAVAEAAEAVA
jgi:hypothetical protein